MAHIIFLLDSTGLQEKDILTKNHNASYKIVSTVREGQIKCYEHTVEEMVGRIRNKSSLVLFILLKLVVHMNFLI